LVVDDNQDAANSLAELVRAWGHEALTAYDGESALQLAREARPGVVFLDIGMPGMDGFEVARRLRSSEALRGLMLVALTGYGQEGGQNLIAEVGFDAHLTKPAAPEALRAFLD